MKAIILAAGRGTRLSKYTANLPKCMLEFAGKTLIQRQVDTLRSCGIKDIVVIKGYMPDAINLEGVKSFINNNFATTNMVHTLFCAEKELVGDVIISYSDIVYEKRVLKKIINDNSDMCVAVDTKWKDYWKARYDTTDFD